MTATTDFEIHPASGPLPAAQRAAVLEDPGFGQTFTDHMVTMRWSAERGWHDGRLEPYGSFTLEPATSVFHYGQAMFEGMKAYRQHDGSITLFRPEENAARFNASARRMAMPELPPEVFVESLELLVSQDRGWVPEGAGRSLYLRPFMIATDPALGFTHPSRTFLFCVVASPATAYFGGGPPTSLTVWLSTSFTRAVRGGTGFAKTGGNYAGAFAAGLEATAHGCDQVVWLDAMEHSWVEEMGGMNLFFVFAREGARPRLMTPALTGTLLPGITRDSLLRLAPRLGYDAVEGQISIDEWREECAAGTLTEVFACGTAAVIAPVGAVRSERECWTVGDGRPGPITLRLREELLGIQHGSAPDPDGWVRHVC
ncbi:branched-chain amino acid aminotransferase [Mumia flava]|uniref:Branched-chain-amino-acid aminotransferase n=1 Tax=Mumia flava TaxID=1348852 RepID=A0A0B2B2E3_9ACTN|nr:branched-chain amino acid aminotransferase [Mumia flava]PJJ54112.1 branched-chain amino acid aminotransferase [Mumia flava]